MICSKCGSPLNDGAVFCPKCGNRIENNTPNNVQNQHMMNNAVVNTVATENVKKKPKTWKVVLITVAATIVAGFVGLGLIVLGSKSTNTDAQRVGASGEVLESQSGVSTNTDETSDAEALDELLGYIDRAEEVVKKANDDYNALDAGDDPAAVFRERADIMQAAYTECKATKDKVVQIQGLDSTVKDAGTEYFNMIISSMKSWYEFSDFMANYFDVYQNIIVHMPKANEYIGNMKGYYNSLDSWYQSAKAAVDAIESYPACVETEWENYKQIVDLNESIVQKEKDACKLNDWLRHYSAKYMSDRYTIAEENSYNELLNCLKGEVSFARNQQSIASNLAEEINSYANMDEDKRLNYEFEYNRVNKISLAYDAVDVIYPSLFNSYDAFVILRTGCISGTRRIVVEAEIPGFTQKYKQSFNLDASYKAIYIKPAALSGDLNLSSAKDAQINISIFESDGTTLIDSKTFPVTLKSQNDVEWYTEEYGFATKDNILCFLTPESKAITELKRTAIDELSGMTSGKMEAFPGYQKLASEGYLSNPYVITYLQAAGIMRALNEMGVRYNLDGFSISGSHQHVLLPEEVLEQRSGLCIETTLVVASALQSADMHVFLVFPPGHAQVAVETWSGSGEYFLIETTAVADNQNSREIFVNGANELIKGYNPRGPISYYTAADWADYLQNTVIYLIDCDDSRILGLTPFAN